MRTAAVVRTNYNEDYSDSNYNEDYSGSKDCNDCRGWDLILEVGRGVRRKMEMNGS